MTDREKRLPRMAEAGQRRVEDRLDRQARALRENLLKRKAQQRARHGAAASQPGAEGDSGGRS